MKIAFVIMNFPVPSETFAQRDIHELVIQGNLVEVFTLRGNKKNIRFSFDDNANVLVDPQALESWKYFLSANFYRDFFKWIVIVLMFESSWLEKLKCLFLLPRALKISREIVSKNYDVVHLFWGHYPSLVGLILKSSGCGIHLSMFLGAYDLAKNLAISRRCAKKSDTLWTHAKANIDLIQKQGFEAQDFKVVYRGLPVARLNFEGQEVYEARDIDFVYVGRLIAEKGVDNLIRSLGLLKKKHSNFSCVIAGDGPLKRKLESLLKENSLEDNCIITGFLSQNEVFELLLRSKNFVMLSVKNGECIPNVVKEAVWSGCYCIVSPFQGHGEILINNLMGEIIKDLSTENVVRHLETRLLSSNLPDLKTSRKFISKFFNTESSAKTYLHGWENVTRNRPR